MLSSTSEYALRIMVILARQKDNSFLKGEDIAKSAKVLDPFMGSGTTAIVCKKLERDFIGIEISPEYCELAEKRITLTNEESIRMNSKKPI